MLAKVFVAFKKQTAKRRGAGNGWETEGKHGEKNCGSRDLELVKHKKKKKKKRSGAYINVRCPKKYTAF